MQKFKRLLSLLLSVVMLLSVVSAANIAFAEEARETTEVSEDAADAETDGKSLADLANALGEIGQGFTEALTSEEAMEQYDALLNSAVDFAGKALTGQSPAVASFEKAVNDFSGKLDTKTPTEEDVAAYEAILAQYQALSDSQQEEVELFAENKFYTMILDYEAYKLYAEGEKLNAAYPKAAETANGIVTSLVPVLTEAEELYGKIIDKKSTLTSDEKIDAFAAASFEARVYVGLYASTYDSFKNKLNSIYCGNGFVQLVISVGNELMKDDPFTEKAPTKVTKPNPSSYEGGENDPEYIAAFNNWLAYRKAYAEYTANKNNHTTKYQKQAWEKIAAKVPEYQGLLPLLEESLAAIDAFNADSSNLEPAKEAMAKIKELSAFQLAFVQLDPALNLRTDVENQTTDYSNTAWNPAKIYEVLEATASYDQLTAFLAIMEEMQPPYTNDMIIKAKEAYANVPAYFQLQIPAEVMAKYRAVLASITYDTPSLDEPDLSIFKKTSVTYPSNVTKEQVEKALPRIESFLVDVLLPILGVDGGLTSVIQSNLYTNATIAELCKFLYPTVANNPDIGGLLGGLVAPSSVANTLTEEKFAGAAAAIRSIGKDWSKLVLQNGDMGFQDGDKEGFIDAVAALFRPLKVITGVIPFENTIDTEKGTYTYGGYEDLVPIFEMLDLEGYISSHEYTLQVNEAAKTSEYAAMDARIRPILVPIFNLIDEVAAAPLDTLLDVLPKLGYLLKTDSLSTQINALLSKGSLLGKPLGISVDLSAEGLYNMVAPMLESLTVGTTTISIHLDKNKFLQFVNDIGGCGDALVKNSVARGHAYRLGIESDKADAFVVLFRWLYGELTTSENISAIQTAIEASDLGTVPKFLIKSVLTVLEKTPADTAMAALINLVAPTFPDFGGGTLPDIDIPGFDGNDDNNTDNTDNGGNTDTDTPSIPKTGGEITTSLLSLAVIAGLVGGAVILKKKQNSDLS